MKDFVGSTIGSYQILREIGRGGMAIVYLGFQPSLQREVAVKVLLPGLTHDPHFVERFMREARMVARLNHPNIVSIHTVDRAEGLFYLVMDYADGGTLEQRLVTGRPLDWPSVVSIADQVAQALDCAHSQGVIHRDVKPSNILLTGDGRAMLADFGIAVAVEQTRLTLTGGRWGTPEYMAPEQALGQGVSPSTDVYALGVVVYEMATGRTPFKADTPVALLHQQVYNQPPSPRKLNPQIGGQAEAAMLMALEKEPAARFPSAGAFAQALRRQPAPGPVTRPKKGGVPMIAAMLLALFLISGLLAGLAVLRTCATMEGMPAPTVAGALPAASVAPVVTESAMPGPTEALPTPSSTWTSTPVPVPPTATWTPSLRPSDTPLPTWTPTATTDPLWQAVEAVIWRYADIKAVATGRTHDDSQLPAVLVGEALKEQANSVVWQRNNGAYYDTTLHWMRMEWVRRVDETHVEALVSKSETLLYYPEGWTTPSAKLSCEPCEYQILYKLELIGGEWFIAEKDVQD